MKAGECLMTGIRHWAVFFLFAFGMVLEVTGQPQVAPREERAPLYFRRVYVPSKDLDELIQGTMPLKRSTFQAMVESINRTARNTLASSRVRIVSAEYSARLVADGLADGLAVLEIEKSAEANTLLSLSPSLLAWGRPQWEGSPDQPAVVGMAATGETFVVVEKPGRLRIPWSLRGTSGPGESRIFDFRVPRGAANRLELEIPSRTVLASQRGLVLRPEKEVAADTEVTTGGERSGSRWIVEMGGHRQTLLTIRPDEAFRRRGPLVFYRQQAAYEITRKGMNLDVSLRIDVHHQPIRQLQLKLDPRLQLLTAQLGQEKLNWTSRAEGKEIGYALQFANPLSGSDRLISLKLTASPVFNQEWELPVLHVMEGVWQEGQASVSLSQDLALVKLQSEGGHETGVGPGPQAGFGHVRSFQFYQPQASVSLVLGRRSAGVHLDVGTRVNLSATRMNGVVVADASASYGQQFVLDGKVATGWIIDAVETDPPGFLEDYDVIRVSSAERTTQGTGQQRLVVRLNRAVQEGQDVRVLVRGHSRSSQGRIIGNRLRMIDFDSTGSREGIIAVGLEPGFQLRLQGDQSIERLDPAQIRESLASALELDSTSLLIRDQPAMGSLRVQSYREQTRYTSEINVEAIYGDQRVEEQYRITCNPENGPLQRLLVHFYRPRGLPMQWTLAGDSRARLVSRQLNQEEQEERGLSGGETWEVSLDQAKLDTFQVVGSRNVLLEDARTLSLAAMPEAITQVGSVAIMVPDRRELDIDGGNLKRIPTLSGPRGQNTQLREFYNYDPSEDVEVTMTRRATPGAQKGLWAWDCTLQSRFTASGYALHQAVYRLENKGVQHLDLRLPAKSELQELMVDGEVIGLVGSQRDERQLKIPLPLRVEFPVVRVIYSVQSPTLRIFAGLDAPLPLVKAPVLQTRWRVLLPPGYALFSSEVMGSREDEGLSVGKRLFGPLYRGSGKEPFRLLEKSDWRQLIGPGNDKDGLAERVDEGVCALGQGFYLAMLQAAEDTPVRWVDVLRHFMRVGMGPDASRLGACWIAPDAFQADQVLDEIEPGAGVHDYQEIGRQLLSKARLSLLVSEHAMVLTGGAPGPGRSNDQQELATPVTEQFTVDRLAARIRQRSRGAQDSWVRLDEWLSSMGEVTSPWATLPVASGVDISDSRWTQHEFDVDQRKPGAIVVCRPLVLHSFAWAGLLVWTGLFTWMLGSRPSKLALVVIFSGLIAVLSPASLYPAPTCLFLGALLASLLVLTWRNSTREEKPSKTTSELSFDLQWIPKTLVPVLLFTVVTTWALWSFADDLPPAVAGVRKVYRLLIPVDKDNKPVGQYDYVPEPFFDELHRRTAKVTQAQAGWLATEAEYRAEVDWRAVREGSANPTLRALVKLEVLKPGQAIRVEVPRETVQVSEIELDGQEIPVNWSGDGDAFILQVPEVGSHVVKYLLRANVRRVDGNRAIVFAIPRIPCSRLIFPESEDMPGISVLNGRGIVRRQLPSGDLVAELGGGGQLGFTWTWQTVSADAVSQTRVEQLTWMKVRPHSVLVDAQFRFSVLRGQVGYIELDVDPRLKMLPLRPGQPVRESPRIQEGDMNRIRVDLTEPFDRDFTLNLSFYMDKTTGVGQLQVPAIEALCDRVVARQLGVSVSDRLQWDAAVVGMDEKMTPQQFAQRWGTDELPDLALRLNSTNRSWTLGTRRRVSQTTAHQELDLVVGSNRVRLNCLMDLETRGSPAYQYRFKIPRGFQVKQLVVRREGELVPSRIVLSTPQQLTVFFQEGVLGKQQLVMEGEWLHGNRSIEVPRMDLETGQVKTREVSIYRTPGVLLEVKEDSLSSVSTSKELGQFQPGLGRLVNTWTEDVEDDKQPMRDGSIQVSRNPGKLRSRSVIEVFRKADAWWAAMEVHVDVVDGVCDELQIQLSESWADTFQLEPSMRYEIKRIPGVPQPRMIIYPELAQQTDFKIRLEGPLILPAGGIRVPDIVPLGMQRSIRYVVLPNRLDQQRIAWETSGLQRIGTLPKSLDVALRSENVTVARVLSGYFRAGIQEVQQVKADPFIHLVDVYLGWSVDGECVGVTTFDLQPAGRTDCILRVPAEYELVDVQVAGLPGNLRELEPGRYRLQLGPTQLSHRIEVVYRGQLTIRKTVLKQARAVTPTIEEFPVGRTLWTVRSPRKLGVRRPRNAPGISTAENQSWQRLDAIARVVDRAGENSSEFTTRQMLDWFLIWDHRFHRVLAGQRRTWDGAEESQLDDPLARVVSRYRQLKENAGVLEKSAAWHEDLGATMISSVWATVVDGVDVLGSFEGERAQFEVVYPGIRQGSDFTARILVCLGILLLSAIGWSLCQSGVLLEWWVRWPYVLGVCLGLGWWLWLTPSLVGIGIILLSAVAAIMPVWIPMPSDEINPDSRTITNLQRLH